MTDGGPSPDASDIDLYQGQARMIKTFKESYAKDLERLVTDTGTDHKMSHGDLCRP